MNLRNTVLLAVLAAGVSILTVAPATAAQEKKGEKGPDPFAGPFTNLKILKPEQVEPTMRAARAGVGACTLCHDRANWADDSKPEKVTARMMISLVRDINSKFADGKAHVSCYTCHRGEEMPLMAAPPAAAPAR
jgi:photosynthetic reaction center cytochrome c subunit